MEESKFFPTDLGVPQGGILSPLLSNIYLNEFDTFMGNIVDTYSTKGPLSKVNPKIMKFSKKMNKLWKEYQETKDINILKEIGKIRKERNQMPSRIRTGTRVYYSRYADD